MEGEIPTFVFLKRGPNKDVAEYLGKFFFLKIEDANAIIGALDVNKMTNLIEKISGGKVGSIDIYDLGINEKAAEAIFDIARSLGSQAILIVTEPELITEVPPPEEIETEKGEIKKAKFVRIGKIILSYRTNDGEEYGKWLKEKWKKDLCSHCRKNIKKAIEILEGRRIPKLLKFLIQIDYTDFEKNDYTD